MKANFSRPGNLPVKYRGPHLKVQSAEPSKLRPVEPGAIASQLAEGQSVEPSKLRLIELDPISSELVETDSVLPPPPPNNNGLASSEGFPEPKNELVAITHTTKYLLESDHPIDIEEPLESIKEAVSEMPIIFRSPSMAMAQNRVSFPILARAQSEPNLGSHILVVEIDPPAEVDPNDWQIPAHRGGIPFGLASITGRVMYTAIGGSVSFSSLCTGVFYLAVLKYVWDISHEHYNYMALKNKAM